MTFCDPGSIAFGFYGAILARIGNVAEGYRYTKLSLRILEKHPSEHWLARCRLIAAGAVKCTTEPLRSLLPDVMAIHQLGLKCGDLQVSYERFDFLVLASYMNSADVSHHPKNVINVGISDWFHRCNFALYTSSIGWRPATKCRKAPFSIDETLQ